MKKSEIKSFEISYTIDADRYQMISYSGHKLIYEKGWSGRITQRSCSGVEDATDWQNPLECAITEEEDKAIHCLLEKTDFESWKPTVDAMTVYVDSLIPMGYRQDLPAFRCTFNNQPYVYFKVFSCIYDIGTVLRSGSLSQIQRDVELERDIVQMLCDICKNHGIELVSITQGFRRALGMAR